jgi:hypothetical protein
MICNKDEKEIRKAYFERKLPKLLNEIQADAELTEAQLQELGDYIQTLQDEDKKSAKQIIDRFNEDEEKKPPTIDELRSPMSDEQKKAFEEWQDEAKKAQVRIKEIIQTARRMVTAGQRNKGAFMDMAVEITALLPVIDQLSVYLEQLYREKMLWIMDYFEVTRAVAEERAKVTVEYRNYKNATLFKDNTIEMVMLLKKYYTDFV